LRRDAAEGGVEVLLSEILLPVYERSQEATVLAQAQELVASLRGGADFAALASQVSSSASSDSRGDLGWVRAATLAPELREPILALRPGQVSDPIAGPNGVQIFQVRDHRVQAAEGAAERARVRQSLEQEQLERQASRYLRDLRRDAFVDVRL
jgi:peptidyl-prolyl cis-trans isomerase SurA